MPWSPSDTLLGTVIENENFNYSVQYYTEEAGELDPLTGLPGPSTQTYYTVNIVPVASKSTVTTTNGTTASIVGYFQKVFNDTIQYRDYNGTIKTLVGDSTTGAWDKLDINDAFEMTSFQPDTSRDMSFSYNATAVNGSGSTISTQTFTIRIFDPSWTSGQTNLKNAVAATVAKD